VQKLRALLALLDGKKRIIVLVAYMAAAIVKATGHGDYEGPLGTVLRVLDWQPDLLPVPASVLAGTAGGIVAITHAVLKDLRASREAANTVSLPK